MTREEYEAKQRGDKNAAPAAVSPAAAGEGDKQSADAPQTAQAESASVVTSSRIVVKKHALAVPPAANGVPGAVADTDGVSVAGSTGRRSRRSRGGRRRRGRSRSPPPAFQREAARAPARDVPVYGNDGGGDASARRVVVVTRRDQEPPQGAQQGAPRYESGGGRQRNEGGESRSRNRSRRRRRR